MTFGGREVKAEGRTLRPTGRDGNTYLMHEERHHPSRDHRVVKVQVPLRCNRVNMRTVSNSSTSTMSL